MRLLYVSAGWCGVCVEKKPVVDAIVRESGLPVEVWDWDADGVQERAAALRIKSPPTLALLDGERVRFRLTGRMISAETAAHLLANTRPITD